ncbi:MAG: ankyrin repeat domain-containing protein [Verrucomicrobiota bacterium]
MTTQPQRPQWRIYLLLALLTVSAWLVYRAWPRDLGKEFRLAIYRSNRPKVEEMLVAHPELVNQANNPPLLAKAMPPPRPATMNVMEEFTVFIWEKVILKPVKVVDEEEEFRHMEEGCMPPLQIAIARNDLVLTRLLIEQGADLKQPSLSGWQAIYLAARNPPDFVKLLLEHGADARTSNHYGHTPLHFSTHNPHTETMELLLKAGADPNAQNRGGHTPLHNSIYGGKTNVWVLLLRYGARLDITNKTGKTPLDQAREYGQTNAIEVFSARQPGPTAPP